MNNNKLVVILFSEMNNYFKHDAYVIKASTYELIKEEIYDGEYAITNRLNGEPDSDATLKIIDFDKFYDDSLMLNEYFYEVVKPSYSTITNRDFVWHKCHYGSFYYTLKKSLPELDKELKVACLELDKYGRKMQSA